MTKYAHRFDVFGRLVSVEATADGWRAWYVGPEGKRRPVDFPIPANLDAEDLRDYLDDLFHECATAKQPAVRRL
jgi:hypothetical protein